MYNASRPRAHGAGVPRKSKGARLYLEPSRREWVIRDGSRFIRLGCPEAEHRKAEKLLADYLGKKHKPEGGPDPLIADVLLVYAQEHVPHTRAAANAGYNINNLAEFWGSLRLSDINSSRCRGYAGTRTPAAARRDLETLRAACGWWCRENGGAVKPSIILPPKPEPRERWLTRQEARRLRLASMKWPHLYRFVILGLMTGSRSGVLKSLRWEWFDLDARIMHRRAPGTAEDARKKTPPVRLGKSLARLLRRWKAKDGGSGYVIAYRGNGTIQYREGVPVASIKRSWKEACKLARIKDASPHTLRHTRATWLMQSKVDLWEAAGHLGMSVETLQRVYGHHHPDFQEKASEV